MARPFASISIDVDTLASIYKGQGLTRPGGYTYLEFRSGMENMARFFEKWNIKATLFMVGNDFKQAGNVPVIRAMHQAGYELANHSMNHPQGFRWLSAPEKEAEIAAMGAICKQVTGQTPVGFRSPGWNIDDATIPLLQKAGYLYDSSVFPTAIMPVMKLAHWRSMSAQPKPVRTTMGQIELYGRPAAALPHCRGDRWRPGRRRPAGISGQRQSAPENTFFLPPSCCSAAWLYRLLYRSIQRARPAGSISRCTSPTSSITACRVRGADAGGNSGTYRPQALAAPLAKKLEVFSAIIDAIAQDYDFITLKGYRKGWPPHDPAPETLSWQRRIRRTVSTRRVMPWGALKPNSRAPSA
jgi:peptidoglycan/xylan/chitin deacetylase (PgdA/CDA1 family)